MFEKFNQIESVSFFLNSLKKSLIKSMGVLLGKFY